MTYGENEGEVFLGRSVTTHQAISDETMKKVDKESPRASSTSSTTSRGSCSRTTATRSRSMAKTLLEWETIDADQINDIMAGKPPRPPKPVAPKQPTTPPTDSGTKSAEPPTHPSPAEST